MAAENVNKLSACLSELFYEKKIPDFWDLNVHRVTYNDLSLLISFADKVKCLYADEDNGLETWWEGQVDGIVEESDPDNPVFYVYYKDTKTDTYVCFDEPLIENYLKGQVKFLDIPDM